MAVKSYRKRAQRPSVVYDPFREALSREIIAVEEQESKSLQPSSCPSPLTTKQIMKKSLYKALATL